MSAVAAPVPARRPRTVARAKAPARARPRLLGGVVWIVALALLLGGIVALNVAVLQLNVRLDRAAETKEELRAANDALSAQLSSAGAAPQVAIVAERKLGLVPASPDQTTYVELFRQRK
jgi:hypothetical protein